MRLCCFTKWPLKLQVLICTYCHSYCRYKRRLILSESQEDNTLKHTKPVMVDDHKLIQRQKQIDIGKNTLSYGRYIEAVKRYWFDNTQLTSTLIIHWYMGLVLIISQDFIVDHQKYQIDPAYQPLIINTRRISYKNSKVKVIYFSWSFTVDHFNLFNPFTPGNFAKIWVLKLVVQFSGHCSAIKS